MIATKRLWLTADGKRLVDEGDPDAASLYAAIGDEIPASAVERFGLKAKEQSPNKAFASGPRK